MEKFQDKNDPYEENFIAGLSSGNKESFDLFINQYSSFTIKTIYYVLRNPEDKEYIEECYDDIIMIILEKCDTFKYECSFKTWVMTIAKNKALDYKRKIKKIYVEKEINEELSSDFNLEENLINNELMNEIKEVLNCLTEGERKLFINKYLLELSTRELCEMYFISEDTLYKRVSRLKKKFKKIWNKRFINKEEC